MNEDRYYNYMNMGTYIKETLLKDKNQLWLRYFKEFVGASMSLFEYEDLPNNLTTKIVEQSLMFRTNLCLANIVGLGNEVKLCIYTPNGEYDEYWNPRYVNLLSLTGKILATNVSFEDIVVVRDNILDIVPYVSIMNYIDHLMTIDMTLDINIELLRLPTMFIGTKEQVAQLNQLFKKIKDFQPYAIVDKNMADSIKLNKMELNYRPDEIYDLLERYRQLAMSSIGIYGADKKRERLITAEVESVNDFVDVVYDERYKERKRWVEEANKKFNLNIKLIERYVENKKDEADITAYETKVITNAENEGGGMDNDR